jgi:hypothetical protein
MNITRIVNALLFSKIYIVQMRFVCYTTGYMREPSSFGKGLRDVVDWLTNTSVLNSSGSVVASGRDSLSTGIATEKTPQNGQDVEPVHDGECAQS